MKMPKDKNIRQTCATLAKRKSWLIRQFERGALVICEGEREPLWYPKNGGLATKFLNIAISISFVFLFTAGGFAIFAPKSNIGQFLTTSTAVPYLILVILFYPLFLVPLVSKVGQLVLTLTAVRMDDEQFCDYFPDETDRRLAIIIRGAVAASYGLNPNVIIPTTRMRQLDWHTLPTNPPFLVEILYHCELCDICILEKGIIAEREQQEITIDTVGALVVELAHHMSTPTFT